MTVAVEDKVRLDRALHNLRNASRFVAFALGQLPDSAGVARAAVLDARDSLETALEAVQESHK